MKNEDLQRFYQFAIDRIRGMISSRYKFEAPTNDQEVVSVAIKYDVPDLNELVFAIKRIEKGVFGQCVICRHDIPIKTLEQDLTARFCPSCQAALHERGEGPQ